jgi:NitT/TauT family transport system substrate-binding protein
MTTRGKIVLTILLLGVVGFGMYRWWDKIAPQSRPQNQPIDMAKIKQDLQTAKNPPTDIPLLIGTNAASLVQRSGIPAVSGVSDYVKNMKDGKLIVEFPINVWPGWAPIIVANAGLDPSDQSVFAKKYGFYVKLSIVDDPVKARDLFAAGQSHVLWGTLDMIALFAPELVKDSRTVPVVCQQVDWSGGGDGIVARRELRSINDFRMQSGKRKKVILAQNSPSHYLIMSLLIDAGIDPGDLDFKWAADAPSAAKIFLQDDSFDAFVGWSPDIYNITDKLKSTRLVVTTSTANHLIADVWAVRNDFYHDHPEIIAGLVQGIFEGIDSVRANPTNAARALSTAFSLPVEDCKNMVGKDGGIAEGDAHLTNYRENAKFFLDPFNPANFEVVWNSASTIYKSLGTISTTVPASKVKAATVLAGMSEAYKDSRDLSQPTFRPDALTKMSAEAGPGQGLLTKAVQISFEPNAYNLNTNYDATIPATLEEIGKLAGKFGNAYIIIEGNTDASRKGIVPADLVRQLSYDRADAVRKAIMEKYKFDPNKFKVVGNGWDNPLPASTDPSNPDNNKRNRRVEVKVFPLETN